jgi:hypothetical protein|tara:strand:- start:142 stop:318 length:177 start_codon:yes stop_codon:yes gene_type:complete
MSKEYNVNATELNNEKECKSCSKGFNISQKFIIFFSFYMLGTSIYGTIKLIELIGSLF